MPEDIYYACHLFRDSVTCRFKQKNPGMDTGETVDNEFC